MMAFGMSPPPLLFLLPVIVIVSCVLANQISPTHAGGAFGRSSHEPIYEIEFHMEESPFHPDEDQESVMMPNKNGQNFLCFLPKMEKIMDGMPTSQQNTSSMIMETEKQIKKKTPDELLEVLKDQCFVRHEGWWSYEFCYQKMLRQFHVEDDKVGYRGIEVAHSNLHWTFEAGIYGFSVTYEVQEFILGRYDAEATAAFNQNLSDVSKLKDPRSKDASQRYHAHQYTNGTTCDLTNGPRETEVRFVCSDPKAMITSITELSTCKYALTIQCPMLCKHPLFQEERPVWQVIHCNMLPKDYKTAKIEEKDFSRAHITMFTDVEREEYAT